MSAERMFVQTFVHEQFGEIRTVIIDGEIWFIAIDVCRALDIANPRDAISSLDTDEKTDVGITDISYNGTVQRRIFNAVNEPGLYRLIFRSRKPAAEKFQRWVYHEVLPSIRQTGMYNVNKTYSGNANFPNELSERWLSEKKAESLIQIAKLTKSDALREKILRQAIILLTDEKIFK